MRRTPGTTKTEQTGTCTRKCVGYEQALRLFLLGSREATTVAGHGPTRCKTRKTRTALTPGCRQRSIKGRLYSSSRLASLSLPLSRSPPPYKLWELRDQVEVAETRRELELWETVHVCSRRARTGQGSSVWSLCGGRRLQHILPASSVASFSCFFCFAKSLSSSACTSCSATNTTATTTAILCAILQC